MIFGAQTAQYSSGRYTYTGLKDLSTQTQPKQQDIASTMIGGDYIARENSGKANVRGSRRGKKLRVRDTRMYFDGLKGG